MSTKDVLIIVGCEELPARYVQYSVTQLKNNIAALLKNIEHGEIKTYATPRRIAVSIEAVATHAASEEKTITGPPADRAFVNGEPTKAAIGFARGKGVDVSALQIVDGPRGPVVAVNVQTGGESAVELLQAGIENAVLKIDFERSMRCVLERSLGHAPSINSSLFLARSTLPAVWVVSSQLQWTKGTACSLLHSP